MISENKKGLIFAETNKKTVEQRANRRIKVLFSIKNYIKRKEKYQEMPNV